MPREPGSHDERPSGGTNPDDTRPPSRVARDRLSGAIRDRAEAYRQDATVDLTLLDVLLRMDEPEAAVRALDEHRASLLAMADDLQSAVADAAVEREAELVCHDSVTGDEQPAPRVTTGRRRVLALTSAAAVVLALVLPSGRMSPRTVLASLVDASSSDDVGAARERLRAARSWARALRAQAAEAADARTTRNGDAASRNSAVRGVLDDAAAKAAAPAPAQATDAGAGVVDLDEERQRRRPRPSTADDRGAGGESDSGLDRLRERPREMPSPGQPLTNRVPRPEAGELGVEAVDVDAVGDADLLD